MNKSSRIKFLLILLLMLFHCIGIAQTNPLSKRITIHATKQSVEKVLGTISSIGKINFSYNPDIIPLDSIVTINYENTEIQKILNGIFHTTYTYKTTGQYIIIQKNKTNQSPTNKAITVKGSVKETGTGNTIANTSVYNINGKEQILTDTNGNFDITFSPNTENISLAINNENYEDTIIFIPSQNNDSLKISLKPKTLKDSLLVSQLKGASLATIEQFKIVSKLLKQEMITHAKNIDFFTERPFQISLMPYIGTNHALSGSITNNFSLNVISGYSYGVNGIEIGGFFNINRGHVNGLQIAGFGNYTGSSLDGFQTAGFFNHILGKVNGVQIAGFSNIIVDTLVGLQISGFSNIVTESVDGFQIAGFSNFSKKDIIGCQISGFMNLAKSMNGIQTAGFTNVTYGNHNGMQISGFANIAKDTTQGIQIAGFANFSKEKMKGIQISGFLNIANDIQGVQLGVINIADTVSGASIGLFNFIRNGLHQISLSTSETGSVNVNLNLGTNRFYTFFGASTIPFANYTNIGLNYGFGTLFFANKPLSYSIELGGTNYITEISNSINIIQSYSISNDLNVNFSKHVALYAGPSINLMMYDTNNTDISVIPQNKLFSSQIQETIDNTTLISWIGLHAGLKFSF